MQTVAPLRLALVLGLVSTTAALAAQHRLSLPPHGAFPFNNAFIQPSGYAGALVLPATGNPGFSMGVTLPNDYKKGSPLTLAVLVDSGATGCNFTMRARALLRARVGHPADLGGINAGLEAHSATTPFSIADGKQNLTFAATATPGTAAQFRYRIVATPGEFAALEPGDAVLFTLVRFTAAGTDTCAGANLNVGGVSVIYTLRKAAQIPARARLTLDPFAAFSDSSFGLIEWNGLEPPLRLENEEFENDAGFGFVVPSDQRPNTPVEVEILWSTAEQNCSFVLAPNFLFRSRAGRGADHDTAGVSDGLSAASASTPFSSSILGLKIDAPPAGQTARATFRIDAGGGFPDLKPGDSVTFGVRRIEDLADDTCTADFSIVGLSVVYDRKNPAASSKKKARRISFNPYGFALDGAIIPMASGHYPGLRLPGDGSSAFATGFVLPEDYKSDTQVRIILLVTNDDFVDDVGGSEASREATTCNFALFSNGLFRARAGHPRDFGNAAGGLEPVRATTPFTASPAVIQFAAPAVAERTIVVEFQIRPDQDFPSLQAGDGINFGMYREPEWFGDDCTGSLYVAGVSALYTTK